MTSRAARVLTVAAVLFLALLLRETSVQRMRTDFDEPVYFEAALRYGDALRDGDLSRLVNDSFHSEHPGLTKLLYTAALLPYGYGPDGVPDLPELTELPDLAPALRPMVLTARRAAELFSLLNVLLLALVSPPAGALLAVHSYAVKYTTQIYLEALPMAAATLAVLAYMRSRRATPWRPDRWWWLSAVALGLTAAGKYIYCVAGLAVAADLLWHLAETRRPRGLVVLLGWGALALLVFYLANPYLWPHPLARLGDSIIFHLAYPESAIVANVGYPWWQPFVWLFRPMPKVWHPGAILIGPDGAIAALGLAGLEPAWRAWGGRGRVVVLWWAIGLAILLLWGTKWPQYSLIMTVPMCLCAGEALRRLARAVRGLPPASSKLDNGNIDRAKTVTDQTD